MERVLAGPPWVTAAGGGAIAPERNGVGGAAWRAAVAAFAYLWTCRRVGARARTLGRPLLRNPARIEIGADALIDSRGAPAELAAEGRGRLIIGSGVTIGPGARLVAVRCVEVGDRVRIGAGCVVSDAGESPGEAAPIWIGDGVTLGAGASVGPGTVIGAGAVIPPGAAVSGAVPSQAAAPVPP